MMTPIDLASEVDQEKDVEAVPRLQNTPSTIRTNWLSFTVKTLLLVGFVLIGLEILFRFAHIGEQEYLQVDPLLGLTHLENKLVTDRSEAFAVSRISSAGLCDLEHQLAKPEGVIRIAVLGDSMTEALQVPTEARFTRLLEKKLNARVSKGQRFEVLNFGNGAFSTGQEYLQFVQTVATYHPDLTVLMFHQGDEEKNPPAFSNWSLRPTFTLNGSQIQVRWKEFDTWRTSESALPLTFFDWGRRNSRIWGVLLQTHSGLKNDPVFTKVSGRIASLANIVQLAVVRAFPGSQGEESTNGTKTEVNALRKQLAAHAMLDEDSATLPGKGSIGASYRWQLTLSLLNLLSAKCGEEGSKFMVASLPAMEQRNIFHSEFQTIEALSARSKFTTLDLTPLFETTTNQRIDSLFLTGHLSKRGHDLVANDLCRKILSTSAIEKRN
jgi:hypothetical protein